MNISQQFPVPIDIFLHKVLPFLDTEELCTISSLSHRYYQYMSNQMWWKTCYRNEFLLGQGQDEKYLNVDESIPWKANCLKLKASVNVFNTSAVQWLTVWTTQISEEPLSVIRFLYRNRKYLKPLTLSNFLANSHPEYLEPFVKQLNLSNLPLEWALRCVFIVFGMPSSQRAINRLLNTCSRHYFAQNPGIFSTEDTVYKLVFSMMLLTTDLHSPKNPTKMTLPFWISNNRGIDEGKDLPNEYLEEIYRSIQKYPVRRAQCRHFEGVVQEEEGKFFGGRRAWHVRLVQGQWALANSAQELHEGKFVESLDLTQVDDFYNISSSETDFEVVLMIQDKKRAFYCENIKIQEQFVSALHWNICFKYLARFSDLIAEF